MKEPEDAVDVIAKRLQTHWHTALSENGEAAWPHRITLLGTVSKAELEARFESTYRRWSLNWQRWHQDHPHGQLHTVSREVKKTGQKIPTHLEIATVDEAVAIAAGAWPERLARGRRRHAQLTVYFQQAREEKLAGIVRAIDELDDLDVDVLIRTAQWFATHDGTGLTPRQVPIEGVHSKWLNTHRHLVATLADKLDLGLTGIRPVRVNFTYLDPDHHGRRYDSYAMADLGTEPLYQPTIIVICENRDTAQLFPHIPGGIAVEGDGTKAGGLLPTIDWIRRCPTLIYWGDIDSAGYEIVNTLRASDLAVTTILMDQDTYDRYERFGTSTDHHGKPLPCRPRKTLPTLHPHERTVYDNLTDPAWTRHRRIEQERIPLDTALKEVSKPRRDWSAGT
ncbi:hypothetical protein IUS38_23275 [Mycobacteroides abscessus subsp. abscessus]|uniref:DUF3322 and DUF2220 domain-containing protein n=1 Tax=Mycobacteroides abscessus TaxID=36809 RepID=UPI0019D2C832|nr:DUF3322 and DUF2220 domain-containing protein [Mycobacteroides abscessus]MBN7438511.1 hypothetical protein [Mycobacteroides abscessus subsp. abscessus]